MKRTLLIVMVALAVLTGAYGIAWWSSTGKAYAADPPHTNYRSGYIGGCGGGAACHTFPSTTFLPQTLDDTGVLPYPNYNNFCLSCHNAAGEAHERKAGSPSTNQYLNLTTFITYTGVNKGVSYIGNAHSWNGLIGSAATRVPVAPGFSGTDNMPGGAVRCQTCHSGMYKTNEQEVADASGGWLQASDQGDQKRYLIPGFATGTKQYLSQYLRVYRSSSYFSSSPVRRDMRQYQVYTGFTYNYQTATITFNKPQGAVGTIYIYALIPQPYFRVNNTANAVCRDCHNNRVKSTVSLPPGTGAKSHHPSFIKYTTYRGFALSTSTLKPSPSGNVYLEYTATVGNRVLCTSCHDPHNAASNNGQLMREADGSTLCGDCHKTKLAGYSTAGSVNVHNGSKHASATVCLDCHTTHDSTNVMLIKNVIAGKRINFQVFSGTNSFGPGNGTGLCEVCHSGLGQHNADGSGIYHHNSDSCVKCHRHSTGFQGPGACDSCHGYPPGNGKGGPTGWTDTTGGKHVAHMGYIQTNFGLTGNAICACCHGNPIPPLNHQSGQSNAFMNTTSHIYWQGKYGAATFSIGSTVGTRSVLDDNCTNVACHSASGTRYWGGTTTKCNGCHGFPPTTGGHASQYASGIRAHLPLASDPIYTNVTTYGQAGWPCGKCHPSSNPNHTNGKVVMSPTGYAACGGGNFSIVTSASLAVCSNVACHGPHRNTPNWF